MKVLKERILRDGKCFEGGILKVDNFINHQMDPILMKSIAVEFVRRFASTNINKVMTIEASGIAPAIMVGYLLELPVVFAKKKKPVTMENMLTTSVYSFTKDHSYDVCVSKDFLQKGDRVLFIDDFLANGNAAKGIIDLVEKAGAELAGMGFIIEKSFQHGGDYLRNAGIRIESLAIQPASGTVGHGSVGAVQPAVRAIWADAVRAGVDPAAATQGRGPAADKPD